MSIASPPILPTCARFGFVLALLSSLVTILLIAEAQAPAACYKLVQTNCCASLGTAYPPDSETSCLGTPCPSGGQVQNGDINDAQPAANGESGRRSFTSAPGATCKYRIYVCVDDQCIADIWTAACDTDTLTGDTCTGTGQPV